MRREIVDKIKQYSFLKENLYKEFYITEEDDKGMFVDTTSDKTSFERPVYCKFKSIGVMGKNGPMNHVGERASFRMYFHNDGLVELLFENNGHCDEIKDFKHLMYLLDPKNLDLKNEIQ